jgi:serine/threonine protein kinase
MEQFQLNEELGKGNYGTVKKVLHKPTNVFMAMKVCSLSPFKEPFSPAPGNPS